MTLGRPRQFDREQALQKAMGRFWKHGYEATSVQDLLDAMGINRSSMYDTFGDKRALFAEVLDYYGKTVADQVMKSLKGSGSCQKRIERMMSTWVNLSFEERSHGCLITNTAVELSSHDPSFNKTIKSILNRVEKAITRTLEDVMKKGELSPEYDSRGTAAFVVTVLQGMHVMIRAGASRAKISSIVQTTLSRL